MAWSRRHGEASRIVIVGEQDEAVHGFRDGNMGEAFIAERRPDRNAEQDHRRDRRLDAFGDPESFGCWCEPYGTAAGVA